MLQTIISKEKKFTLDDVLNLMRLAQRKGLVKIEVSVSYSSSGCELNVIVFHPKTYKNFTMSLYDFHDADIYLPHIKKIINVAIDNGFYIAKETYKHIWKSIKVS